MISRSLARWFGLAVLAISVVVPTVHAATVTGRTLVVHQTSTRVRHDEVVVWLRPVDQPAPPYSFPAPSQPLRLTQKDKSFHPHLLVIRAGSVVQFPNKDPFFHNVFSLFDGKRFDLGLYEAGSSRSVRFDRPGVSYIFCNIHSQMSAVVIALDTPYYAVSGRKGSLAIPDVPPGRYVLHVWHEGTSPKALAALQREIVVAGDRIALGSLRVIEDELPVAHKNKYGRDYDDPTPASPAYPQQP